MSEAGNVLTFYFCVDEILSIFHVVFVACDVERFLWQFSSLGVALCDGILLANMRGSELICLVKLIFRVEQIFFQLKT